MLPLLDPTTPDATKPRTILTSTSIWVAEDNEIEATITSYNPTSAPTSGTVAIVVAKIAADGASAPVLDAVSIAPLAGQPFDTDYNEHLPEPFRPVVTTIGVVDNIDEPERRFTIVGRDWIVSSCFS